MSTRASVFPFDGHAGYDGVTNLWGGGWRRIVFPAFWLIYLGQTISGVSKHAGGGWSAVAGYAVVVAFAACYLTALPMGWSGRHRSYWVLYGVCLALTAAECFFANEDALVFLVYVAVLTVAPKAWLGLAAVVALTLVAALLPAAVPAWHTGVKVSLGLSVLLVALAMFGFFKIIEANIALTAARAEVARLAAENERSRIARDLHDLLGHSLTTITVKAGLARRLGERGETDRALTEIAEVEQLSRRTLGDVRAAVSAQREVTLAGELATAREVLRAAGVIAELPPTVAESDPSLSELFGWIVREGTTNVVRHSHAEHVRISLARTSIEIVDDGTAAAPGGEGNGLRGLRERVAAAGGTLDAHGDAAGFRLRAEVPADGERRPTRPVQSAAPRAVPAQPAGSA